MKKDRQYKQPLRNTVLLACVIVMALLALALSLLNYFSLRRNAYEQYDRYLGNILHLTAARIDTDDLADCIRTGQTSEKYVRLREELDFMRDTLEIHFIYIVVPLNTNETDNMMNVVEGTSIYEYEHEADEIPQLGQLTGNSYSAAVAKEYLKAYESGELSFFEEVSQWGDDYTGLLPLRDSAGDLVAALCADVEISEIHAVLRTHFATNLLIILGVGLIATVLFLQWTRRRVTRPIEELARSVAAFASAERDPAAGRIPTLHVPPIAQDNEIASLAHAVEKLGDDINSYMLEVLSTEQQLGQMTLAALKDALTRVGNKAAFSQQAKELNEQARSEQVKFAVVMADVNSLKHINDNYGHSYGDQYLKACCSVICDVYRHSPVFRVGGDEFVVLLTGRDYYDRKVLLERTKNHFRQRRNDFSARPWERLSVALGMADATGEPGETVEDVLARADKRMYQDKKAAKRAL